MANFGTVGVDWQQRVNWDRLRKYRLERARERMKAHNLDDQTLGVDFIDINMLNQFGEAKLKWADGMTPMMEARAIKNVDEQECLRVVGAIGDAAHWETMRFLKPGLTENQVTAHIME